MKKQEQFYQGDVGLIRVNKLPAGAKKAGEHKSIVLAYGEATGHHHKLCAGSSALVSRFEVQEGDSLVSYVEIAEALAQLQHEEHGVITLEPGVYKVLNKQREYVAGEIKQVVD